MKKINKNQITFKVSDLDITIEILKVFKSLAKPDEKFSLLILEIVIKIVETVKNEGKPL